jgi:hypothetical protein
MCKKYILYGNGCNVTTDFSWWKKLEEELLGVLTVLVRKVKGVLP